MSELKFVSGLFEELSNSDCVWRPSPVEVDMITSKAQQIFDDWLEEQTVVYTSGHQVFWSAKEGDYDTHKARLICVEDLPVKECEHEIKSSTVTLVSNGDTKFKCYKCGCELKATWSEA